jgi:hypothetical protein
MISARDASSDALSSLAAIERAGSTEAINAMIAIRVTWVIAERSAIASPLR